MLNQRITVGTNVQVDSLFSENVCRIKSTKPKIIFKKTKFSIQSMKAVEFEEIVSFEMETNINRYKINKVFFLSVILLCGLWSSWTTAAD